MRDVVVTVAGEVLALMPERAAYWAGRSTLFVADVHVGKAAAFRARGMAVPEGHVAEDLARLSAAVARHDPTRVVILGDVLHARDGRSPVVLDAVATWRQAHSHRHLVLVRGNHDLRSGDPPAEWQMACVDEPWLDAPFALCHAPCESDAGYVLAGHVHPAVSLRGRGRTSIKLPCFIVGARRMVLPAFGSFTGAAHFAAEPGDRYYAIADDEVVPL